MIQQYYIAGLGCTSEIKKRLKDGNEYLLELRKKPDNKTKLIAETERDIINLKNGIIRHGCVKNVCVNGSWQNIISAYMNRGFVTTEGNDKQLEFVKDEIIEDINNGIRFVLITGISFGGMVANKLYKMLEDTLHVSQLNKVRVITINSIQISQNPKIVNYMHIGDIALKTNRLNTPPPRYLDTVLMKGTHVLIRYSSKLFRGNIIWYCYPSSESKTRGKCKHISHVSFFNPYSHRNDDLKTIIKILKDMNEEIDKNCFDSNLITLVRGLSDFKDDHETLKDYKIKNIDSIRRERTKGGKRVKRKKTLKSYLNI